MEYINLNYLKSFYYVGKERSISKAANLLFVQQPALSKTIKKLEESLGVSLIQRQGRGIELTNEGEEIYGKCEEIFSQINSISNYSQRLDIRLTDSIQLSTNDAIATIILPKIIKTKKDDFPHIRPILKVEQIENALENIINNKSSIGLYFYVPKLPSSLKVIKRIGVKYKLVISKSMFHSHKVRSQFIGSREVENINEIKYPALEDIKKVIPDVQIHYSTNCLFAHKEMVIQGLGISILPEFLIRNELKNGLLQEILIKDFSFDLKIISLKGTKLTTYIKDIIREIELFSL